MISRFIGLRLLIFYLLTISVFCNSSGKFTSEEELLLQYKNEIIKASEEVCISPRMLQALYTLSIINVKLGESILDYVFAKSGYILLWELLKLKLTRLFG